MPIEEVAVVAEYNFPAVSHTRGEYSGDRDMQDGLSFTGYLNLAL